MRKMSSWERAWPPAPMIATQRASGSASTSALSAPGAIARLPAAEWALARCWGKSLPLNSSSPGYISAATSPTAEGGRQEADPEPLLSHLLHGRTLRRKAPNRRGEIDTGFRPVGRRAPTVHATKVARLRSRCGLCSAKMSSDRPDWSWQSRVGSVRGSRRGLLQGVLIMETAQNCRAANNVPGGDYMTAPIRRWGMREWHRYPRAQTHVRSAVVEMRDPMILG